MSSALATQAVFIVLTVVTLGGAIGVVNARTVFVSALWLILSFLGVAGLTWSRRASSR
jgi:NADH:ubiquinone oxidoreductase subunit 6 (subunit J)